MTAPTGAWCADALAPMAKAAASGEPVAVQTLVRHVAPLVLRLVRRVMFLPHRGALQ